MAIVCSIIDASRLSRDATDRGRSLSRSCSPHLDGKAYVANWFSGDISIIDLARASPTHYDQDRRWAAFNGVRCVCGEPHMNRALPALLAFACVTALTACEDRKQQREAAFTRRGRREDQGIRSLGSDATTMWIPLHLARE